MKTRIRQKGKLTQEDFNRIRQLFNLGVGKKEVANIVGVSTNAVGRCLKVKTWAEFEAMKAEFAETMRKRMTKMWEEKKGQGLKNLAQVELPLIKTPKVVNDETILSLLREISAGIERGNELTAKLIGIQEARKSFWAK